MNWAKLSSNWDWDSPQLYRIDIQTIVVATEHEQQQPIFLSYDPPILLPPAQKYPLANHLLSIKYILLGGYNKG